MARRARAEERGEDRHRAHLKRRVAPQQRTLGHRVGRLHHRGREKDPGGWFEGELAPPARGDEADAREARDYPAMAAAEGRSCPNVAAMRASRSGWRG